MECACFRAGTGGGRDGGHRRGQAEDAGGSGRGRTSNGRDGVASRGRGSAAAGNDAATAAATAARELAEEEEELAGGCARTTPLNWALRRSRREPAAIEAALAKRRFVEATPYVVTGRKHASALDVPLGRAREPREGVDFAAKEQPIGARRCERGGGPTERISLAAACARVLVCVFPVYPSPAHPRPPPTDHAAGPAAAPKLKKSKDGESATQRFLRMRRTLPERLTCGKSAIHGWGAFTKVAHRKGDMVIEYVGQLVRPCVAELRELRCYNTLVGAGTYTFRVRSLQSPR